MRTIRPTSVPTCVGRPRERGVALLTVLALTFSLLVFTAISVQMVQTHAVVRQTEENVFVARQIAESALAQALGRLKEAGVRTPVSGDGTEAYWMKFGSGEFYYDTVVDDTTGVTSICAWGRVPLPGTPSYSQASPLDADWDGRGYVLQGLEMTLKNRQFVPDTPLYLGNGGIQRPLGGVEWVSGTDPFDPSTWRKVSGSPESWQSATVDLEISALDHPVDHLASGSAPTPASAGVHPHSLLVSKNPVGQQNAHAWMNFSADGGAADSKATPSPWSNYAPSSTDPEYAFPVDSAVPDVQDYVDAIWNRYSGGGANLLTGGGSLSGTYGDLATPQVTIVTGGLRVPTGQSFSGAGILVIRDDYDPNTDVSNTPNRRAFMRIQGDFEWSGLVIMAGWNPYLEVAASGNATILGSMMAEDSVMSMGETSLATSMLWVALENPLRILYSSQMFEPGGIVQSILPGVRKEILGFRELTDGIAP